MNIIVDKYQKLNTFIKCIIWLSLILFIEITLTDILTTVVGKLTKKSLYFIYDNISQFWAYNVSIWLSYSCVIPIIAILLFLLFRFEKNLLCEYFSKSMKHNLKLLSFGFLIGMIEVFIPIICAILSGSIEISTIQFSVIAIIGFFFDLIPPIFEELCSRLCVYGFLIKYTNSIPAIIFSVIFFLLPHVGNFITFGVTIIDVVSLAVGAISYCIILKKSKSLLLVTGIHFGWNYMQTYIFNVGCSGLFSYATFIDTKFKKNSFFYDEIWGIEGTWIAPIMDIVLCIAFLIYYQTKHPKED